jgi:magnesium transporter
VIKVRVFRKGEELATVPVADLSEIRQERSTLIGVDVVDATPDELAQVGEEFDLHPLVLATCGQRGQRPRAEQYEDYVLYVGYTPGRGDPEGRVRLHEVDLVSGGNWLLAFHGGAPIDSDAVEARVRAHPELVRAHGGGFLLYVALDELVDTFFPTLDAIGERVEDLEEGVFEGHNQVQGDIFRLRKDLVAIRRVAGPMRDAMVLLLRRDLKLFGTEGRRYLQDIYDHLIRIVETVEDYQDLAAGALEANLSVVSNRVNEVARSLTAYAAIFAAVTLITGVYGMNFRHMPELDWRFGYAYALGLILASAGALGLYFKRKGWL